MDLTVKLDIYEGPLDLLLHLIKKNEVDIYDIPIALITEQYLEYLQVMESMNIELAGEFLLMAATLTQIKSRLLLPSIEDDEDSDEEDPRMEIVRPLLEHMKMKDAAEALERRDMLNRDVFTREVSLADLGIEPEGEEHVEASLFDLIDAFRRIIQQYDPEAGLRIVVETKTIQQRLTEVLRLLKSRKQVGFEELCATDRTKLDLILTFLTILELARVGSIRLFQHQATRAITLFYVEGADILESSELPDPDQAGEYLNFEDDKQL